MAVRLFLALIALYLTAAAGWIVDSGRVREERAPELLNVSYDPTRELWRDLNLKFVDHYRQERGEFLVIRQSHGSSGSQAVQSSMGSMPMWLLSPLVRRRRCAQGLIAENWETRLPNRSLPYSSTVVFVVRKGNPKAIHDWPDRSSKTLHHQ